MCKTIYVVGGPTASGKSSHALKLADEHDGVIINADSMQIYDGLQTLTAQPPAEDLAAAPHLLYSYLHPNDDCSAGNWREMVTPIIAEVLETGKTPIIVGGSGLYINALLYGLSPIPDIPDAVRQASNKKQADLGNPAFHTLLSEHDPVMGEKLDPHNTARLIRAWEVLQFSGKSLSEWQSAPLLGPPDEWQFDVSLIMPERETLYDRCNQRFIQMLDHGALEEVKIFNQRIESGEVKPNALLAHSLGYRPLLAYLNGELDKETTIDQGQRETRRYAKRQVTWFRNQIKENKNVAQITVIT